MRILYIYRHPDMGFSIGKVFKPIEEEMKKYAEVDSIYLPVPNYKPKGLWRNIKAARQAVKAMKYDIVHITGAEHYLIPFLSKEKVVVTVHDLGFYTNNKWSVQSWWKYMGWIYTLKFADRITFISEKSMLEAKSLVKLNKEKVEVIDNAVSPDFVFSPKTPNFPHPLLLQIGTGINKNLTNTILAIRNTKYRLRIIGKLNQEQKALLDQYNINYSVAENLTDEQIVKEYKHCDIVSFHSLYEGFGMPIIEGQATGRPVVTSNLSPMCDIAGDAAVLVNPTDVDSIRNGYENALLNWDKIVLRGLKNTLKFSTGKIASDYLKLYRTM